MLTPAPRTAGIPLAQAGGLPPRRSEVAAQAKPAPAAPQAPSVLPAGLAKVVLPSAQDRWTSKTAKSYTPDRIEQILRGALNGDLREQWELFDLMEDTAPRINQNLNKRKRAVLSFIRNFEPWYEEEEIETPEALKRAKLASSAFWSMRPKADENQNGFDATIYDILDSIGKGTVVLEIDWEVRTTTLGSIFAPQCTRWIHPRYYGWPAQAHWLGLNVSEIKSAATAGTATAGNTDSQQVSPTMTLTAVEGNYARFPENKFLICTYRGKSGHPAGTALLRRLALIWAASNFAQSWFLNFAQIFGLPIRWANYDPNTPGLLERVMDMLENMGSAAFGAFPAGTTLELKEPMKAGSDNPQISLLDRADKLYDIAILGQSGTTEVAGPGKSGGSYAANQVLEGVEEKIVRADAAFVCSIFNEQFIPMVIRLNYGDTMMLPELCLEPEVVEDVKGLLDNYKTGTEAGALTPNSEDEIHFRKKLNLPAMPKPVVSAWEKDGGFRLPQRGAGNLPGGTMPAVPSDKQTANAKAKATDGSIAATLVDAALADATGIAPRWLGAVRPIFEELMAKAADDSVTDADFIQAVAKAKDELPDVFDRLDHNALARVIEQTMAAGVVNGAVKAALKRKVVAA